MIELSEKHNLNKGNLSQFFGNKRSSIAGYTKPVKVSVLNCSYDTIVLTKKAKVNSNIVDSLLWAKEEARDNNGLHLIKLRGHEVCVKSKSFGMYNATFLYMNHFQISVNEKMINIKVLAKCFYKMTLQEIYDALQVLSLDFFELDIKDFKVSKIDKAIDIEFDFKFLKYVIENFTEKVKPFVNSAKVQIYREQNGSSAMVTCGNVQMIFYEKVLETFNNKDVEKKEIFSKLFDIDINNAFEVQRYLESEKQIVRWEYRVTNKNKFLDRYDVNVEKLFFNIDYINCIIKMLLDKHTTVDFEEMQIIERVLQNDETINIIDVNIDKVVNEQLENCLSVLASYVSSVHSKYELISRKEFKLEEVLEYVLIRLEEGQFKYYDKLEDKRNKIKEGIY